MSFVIIAGQTLADVTLAGVIVAKIEIDPPKLMMRFENECRIARRLRQLQSKRLALKAKFRGGAQIAGNGAARALAAYCGE